MSLEIHWIILFLITFRRLLYCPGTLGDCVLILNKGMCICVQKPFRMRVNFLS